EHPDIVRLHGGEAVEGGDLAVEELIERDDPRERGRVLGASYAAECAAGLGADDPLGVLDGLENRVAGDRIADRSERLANDGAGRGRLFAGLELGDQRSGCLGLLRVAVVTVRRAQLGIALESDIR